MVGYDILVERRPNGQRSHTADQSPGRACGSVPHRNGEGEAMRLPRLSANGWLLVVFAIILMGLVGEPAYRAITGRKSADEVRLEKLKMMEAKYAAGPQLGDAAPPFPLKSATDGHKVSLSDFKGRRVVMTFYCGCSYCREVAKDWEKLQKQPLKGNPVF